MDEVKTPEVFYFGFLGSGHHLYDFHGEDAHREVTTPWGYYIDGKLCPQVKDKYEPQGIALLHHKDGWTAIGFWDRSGDTRYGSNSNFLVLGEYTFDEMLALAKAQYPGVFKRMKFSVVEVTDVKTV